ncbi:MAG: permease [Hyphomicrobiales bacterium]|nr:permease [Hyphomicrobiales bacterium]
MSMTHYMELLTSPLNLLMFMAIPVVLAETLAITEFYILYTSAKSGPVRAVNRAAGIVLGVYFVGVFLYLLVNAVMPITQSDAWRGWIDMIAVGAYLAGVAPLAGIALLELGVIFPRADARQKLAIHAGLISVFLVVGHVAMVFGMIDPRLGGWSETAVSTPMHMPAAGSMQHSH